MPPSTFTSNESQEISSYLFNEAAVKPTFYLRFGGWLAISAVVVCLSYVHPIAAQNVQRNNEAADLGLRSNLTVNPATLGLELQIMTR